MRDLEQELAHTMARAYDSHGQAREGFFNLTRRMDNDDDDQFDVDHTILDFLTYKATATVFEWQACENKWERDLPNALVTMTAAARTNLGDDWQPKSDWFDLAGQFMLQAVVDQYLVHRECQLVTMKSIFAFGSVGAEHDDGEGTDSTAMRRLFCRDDQPAEELPEWTAIRRRYLKEVCREF
ncbi:hypothetical protein N0V95_006174 [Ascochyta clinopodiicola]|nr:hypothetical protein N0V95_006174 [Ascochyta clinopodiicola]